LYSPKTHNEFACISNFFHIIDTRQTNGNFYEDITSIL